MKKIILNESDKKMIISAREKAIIESFGKTFNKIKRDDEEEINDDILEEGWKDWVLGGLLTISSLGGGLKLYQLHQEKQQDRQAQTEYYTKVLEPVVAKSGDLSGLGAEINSRTRHMSFNDNMTLQDIDEACQGYAEKYMQVHAKEFGVGTDGKIYWIPALNQDMQTN